MNNSKRMNTILVAKLNSKFVLVGSIIENMGGSGPFNVKVIESGVIKAPSNSPKRSVKKMKGNGLIFLYSLKKE